MCARGKQRSGGGNLYFNALPPLHYYQLDTRKKNNGEQPQEITRHIELHRQTTTHPLFYITMEMKAPSYSWHSVVLGVKYYN